MTTWPWAPPGATGATGGDAFGGGVYVAAGTANLAYADFDFNFATGGVGGVGAHVNEFRGSGADGGNGGNGMGGGLYVAAGTANLTYSVVLDNSAQGGNGGNAGSNSGGEADGGNAGSGMGAGVNAASGVVALADDTFYGDTAQGGNGGDGGDGSYTIGVSYGNGGNGGSAMGGGLYVSGGAVTLTNDTLNGSNASTSGGSGGNPFGFLGDPGGIGSDMGGGMDISSGSVTMNNTLIAGNTAGSDYDVSGNLETSSANDLIDDGTGSNLANGVNGDQVGSIDYPINPLLGPWQNNGGSTETMALLPGSPAIDAGSTALAVDPTTGQPLAYDQRGPGFARIENGTVDIGSFEVQQPISTTTAVTTSAIPAVYGDSVIFTATVTGTSTPTGSVNFVIDSGTAVAATAGSTTGTTAIWTYATSTLTAGAHTVQAFYVATGSFANSNCTLSGGQTVNAAALTITANNVPGKTYGATLTPAGTEFSSMGLVNGDTISSVSLESAATRRRRRWDTPVPITRSRPAQRCSARDRRATTTSLTTSAP